MPMRGNLHAVDIVEDVLLSVVQQLTVMRFKKSECILGSLAICVSRKVSILRYCARQREGGNGHAAARPNSTWYACVAKANEAVANAVNAYPNTASGFRFLNWSV